MDQKYSFYLDQASDLLNSALGNSLEFEDRLQKSIRLAELLFLHSKQLKSTKDSKNYSNNILEYLQISKNKALYFNLIDQGFRTKCLYRTMDQFSYLLHSHEISKKIPLSIKWKFLLFKFLGPAFPKFVATLIQKEITNHCLTYLNFADSYHLHQYLLANKNLEISFWLIQNPAFGKKHVEKNLRNILNLIINPEISTLCINISDISSYLYLNFENLAKKELEENLKKIFKLALANFYRKQNITKEKIIILDFDSYKNLDITIEVLEKLLLLDDFLKLKVGLILKACFPESFDLQKRLTEFAKKRLKNNGNNIFIKIMKRQNFNLEQTNASKNNWPSPTYFNKTEIAANFIRMIDFGCKKENATVLNLSITTSNIFEIAYSLFLMKENTLSENEISFELPQNTSIKPIIQTLRKFIGNNLKILCPIIFKKEMPLLSSFFLKNNDDFNDLESFEFQSKNLFPGTKKWEEHLDNFKQSFDLIDKISSQRKHKQNRNIKENFEPYAIFENNPITDFSIKANTEWAENIIEKAKKYTPEDILLTINNKDIKTNSTGLGKNPSDPFNTFYKFHLANENLIEEAILSAKKSCKTWQNTPLEKREEILLKALKKLRENRAFFIKNLITDIAKSITQSDLEISDAIDSMEYQIKQFTKISSQKDIKWQPKGLILVIPAWSFPLATAAEAITSALISGNVVILKPLEESVLICRQFANLMWEAGVPKECLQFINCSNKLFDKKLVADPRINSIIISTSSKNANKLIKIRNNFDCIAIKGGINSIIATNMSDKNQAIKYIIDSAFSFSGQKFSSASLLILEKDLYYDKTFRDTLKEAAENLITNNAYDPNAFITPLIQEPDKNLQNALTILNQNEWWLVKPQADKKNPHLYSCGIKYNTKIDYFRENPELNGPILSVMCANDLDHAIQIANRFKSGLGCGLQSLDPREHLKWLKRAQAGNYYINSPIVDAKINRQPFGGFKESSFGLGFKSGGPNYILNFVNPTQINLPKEKLFVNDWVNGLTTFLEKIDLSAEQLGIWYASIANYAYWWKKLKQNTDSHKIFGQDNFLGYVPRKNITLRISKNTCSLDALKICAAALTCSAPLEISWSGNKETDEFNWIDLLPVFSNIEESEDSFIQRVKEGKIRRVRLTSKASEKLKKAASESACFIIDKPVLANGRYELLNYIKEISITYNYHRYGNLGVRDLELRKPLT